MQEEKQQVKVVFNQNVVDTSTRVDYLAMKTLAGHEETTASLIEDTFEDRILGTVIGCGIAFMVATSAAPFDSPHLSILKY